MPKDLAHLVNLASRASHARATGAAGSAANAAQNACDPDVPATAPAASNRASRQAIASAGAEGFCPLADLTPRQRQVMALVLAGHPSKIIAADLTISRRTVENHRAAIMRRTGATSLPALVRLSLGVA